MEYAVEYAEEGSNEPLRVWCENKKSADLLSSNLGARGIVTSITPQRKLEPFSHAVHNANVLLERIEKETNPSSMVMVLSGGGNFREHVATIKPYKGNRDPAARPTYEQEMREHLIRTYPTEVSDGEEADDVMGICQTQLIRDSGDAFASCIASGDKDLLMIPGLHFNFLNPERPATYVGPEEGMQTFLTQWLTGDSTDNIPGVPKIGAKRAAAALSSGGGLDAQMKVIRDMYTAGYGEEEGEAAMLENGQLIWIRRAVGEMFDLNTPKLYV